MCTKHQDWIVLIEWHGQGCFSATYTANPKYVSIRSKQVGSRDLTSGEYWWMRGQNLAPCCQDLGTQLYHSSTYTTACQKANKEKGKFVSIALGESLSGVQPVSECVWISVDLDIGWCLIPINFARPTEGMDFTLQLYIAWCPDWSMPLEDFRCHNLKHLYIQLVA